MMKNKTIQTIQISIDEIIFINFFKNCLELINKLKY